MKFLRLYESSNEREVIKTCKELGIKKYKLRPDGKIDVNGDVSLIEFYLDELPIKFGIIHGNFDCSFNSLTTLEGCPETVDGGFSCAANLLETLESGPNYVGGDYDCSQNLLTSLVGSPQSINGDFGCEENLLTTLEGSPYYVEFAFNFESNPVINWKGAPETFEEVTYEINDELDEYFKSFLKLNSKNTRSDEIVKYIFENQDEINIWRRDGSLNIARFKQMMKASGLDIILPDI